MNSRSVKRALGVAALMMSMTAGHAGAQVPADIEAGLLKIGQIVDPGCTAKLYRPLMPANDVNSTATPLYPGITIARDISFGPDPKDVLDVFTADKGGGSRPVLIYVAGGAGNKIEQHAGAGCSPASSICASMSHGSRTWPASHTTGAFRDRRDDGRATSGSSRAMIWAGSG